MQMHRHLHKEHFSILAFSVIVLEVLAYTLFLGGTTTALYGMSQNVDSGFVIITGLGSLVLAFLIMATGEMIQLLMRIEHNTRSLGGKAPVKKATPKKKIIRKRK